MGEIILLNCSFKFYNNMKVMQKISILIIYFIFSQVYPFVHWHAHEHHDELKVELSVHPPEYPVENHDHEEHSDHAHAHHPNNIQFIGDKNYTTPVKNFKLIISEQIFFSFVTIEYKPHILSHAPLEYPLKFPQDKLLKIIPQRAPPEIC